MLTHKVPDFGGLHRNMNCKFPLKIEEVKTLHMYGCQVPNASVC